MKKKLTNKQERFVKEYLVDLNASQAAIRAGYKGSTAFRTGVENMQKPLIKQAIAKELEKRNNRLEVNADYVLRRLVGIDQMDVLDILDKNGDLKPVKDWPKVWRTTLSGIDISRISGGDLDTETVLKKIKWPDKVRNLELIGRHIDVKAWYERDRSTNEGAEKVADALHEVIDAMKV